MGGSPKADARVTASRGLLPRRRLDPSHAGPAPAPPNRVTQIIHGRRGVTGDTALRLGHWFGTSAQFWLNLQNAYDIRVAEQRAGQEIAQLPTRPATPVADRLAQPRL